MKPEENVNGINQNTQNQTGDLGSTTILTTSNIENNQSGLNQEGTSSIETLDDSFNVQSPVTSQTDTLQDNLKQKKKRKKVLIKYQL